MTDSHSLATDKEKIDALDEIQSFWKTVVDKSLEHLKEATSCSKKGSAKKTKDDDAYRTLYDDATNMIDNFRKMERQDLHSNNNELIDSASDDDPLNKDTTADDEVSATSEGRQFKKEDITKFCMDINKEI